MLTRVLHLCAEPPDPAGIGGVPIHVAALAGQAPPDVESSTAYPVEGALVVERWRGRRTVIAAVEDASLADALQVAIASTDADVVHVHSTFVGPAAIAEATERTGTALVLTLHDHALVCPEYRLLEAGLRYCGIPDDERRCTTCLQQLGKPHTSRRDWQAEMRKLVDGTTAVVAPSRSALELNARAHPSLHTKGVVIPWGVPTARMRHRPGATSNEPLRVGVVGVVADIKGHARLPELVSAARHLNVEWHLFGASEGRAIPRTMGGTRLTRHGAYRRGDLPRLLAGARIDVCLLPSIGPETFSLVHAEVVAAGIPAITSNLGALAERVAETNVGWTFDPWLPETLADCLRALTTDRARVRVAAERARQAPPWTEVDMARAHVPIWQRARSATARDGPELDRRRALEPEVDRAREAAGRHKATAATRLVAALRHTRAYRDLPLRRLLSESRRKRFETALRRRRLRRHR